MLSIEELLRPSGILPIVSGDDASTAVQVGRALKAGGLRVVEVTLRSANAIEAVQRLADDRDLIVGAGTVRTVEQVHLALMAGAQFIVSPCFSVDVMEEARILGLPLLPGVTTANELQRASENGIRLVKLFPAETSGGFALLRALAEPFYDMQFVPTGGITKATMTRYLGHPQVVAVGGSWIVAAASVRLGNWTAITHSAREALAVSRSARKPLGSPSPTRS